jgi:hypothetical protein
VQITCFLAIFIYDIRRQESGRLEFCCWRRFEYEPANSESYMMTLLRKFYSPLLFKDYVRMAIVCLDKKHLLAFIIVF